MLNIDFSVEMVRPPVAEKIFYPDDAAEVEARLYAYGLERGRGGNARAIIAHHGAWGLSGQAAALSFAAAAGRSGKEDVKTVLILGPIHKYKEYDGEGIFLSESDSFDTPLGKIAVDQELSGAMAACSPLFIVDDIPHLREHSIEVLLPMVKYCFPDAAMIPVLMGGDRKELITALAKAMKSVFGPLMHRTLCVVSCNISQNTNPASAKMQAEKCLKTLTQLDAQAFLQSIADGSINACGHALAASLLAGSLVKGVYSENGVIPAPQLQKVKGEEDKTVYFSSLAFR